MRNLFLCLVLILLFTLPVYAKDVTIHWDNASTDIEGNQITIESVNIYQSSVSDQEYVLIGNAPVTGVSDQYTVQGLASGTYYFVLTSVYRNLESAYSKESWTAIMILPKAPTAITIIIISPYEINK